LIIVGKFLQFCLDCFQDFAFGGKEWQGKFTVLWIAGTEQAQPESGENRSLVKGGGTPRQFRWIQYQAFFRAGCFRLGCQLQHLPRRDLDEIILQVGQGGAEQ